MTHRHAGDEPDVAQKCVEIDPHVCLQSTSHSLVPPGSGIPVNSPEAEAYGEHHYGFIFGHDRDGFEARCEGGVRTCREHFGDDAGASWDMTGSLDGSDLTLSPSILCQLGSATVELCGFHGFVREGKWVPA